VPDVQATLFTDPACPWSWAAEPARLRLVAELGDGVEIRLVMAGLARELTDAPGAARAWLDAAAASGMPADPRLWLDAPPRSTYPACLAVKAAAEQRLDGSYLRRAREGFAFERRSLDRPEALLDLARTVAGLDVERFRVDLGSNAIVEAFGADLERAREAGAGGEAGLPILHVAGPAGERWVRGPADPAAWVDAAVAAGGRRLADPRPAPLEALRRFGRLGTPEVAAVCGLPGPTAPAELWRLAAAWEVRAHRQATGELWEVAG
jgi:predicted DsbA family dithiol-disulfide isomerase